MKKERIKKKVNVHKGHRARMRKRFIQEESLDSFDYHQVLELILFYCVKMGDTNPLAHKILNEYNGSFADLLDANCGEIMERCNLSESTSLLISAIPHIFKKYMEDKLSKMQIVDSLEAVCNYFKFIMTSSSEGFYVLYLDAAKKLIKPMDIGKNFDKSNIKDIIEEAIILKAYYVFVGHNVMELGNEQPSEFDIQAAKSIRNSFEVFDIVFMDYIVFYQDDKSYSFLKKELFDNIKQDNLF